MRKTFFLVTIVISILADVAAAQSTRGKGNMDYPPDALAKREQGAVLVDLTIAPDAKITNCTVLVSSNSPSLDRETCSIFIKLAHFNPATDAQGNPVEDHALGKITWVIPGCRAPKQPDPRLHEQVPASMTVTSLEHC